MKYTLVLAAIVLSFVFSSCQNAQQHRTELKTLQDSVSYGMGVDFERNFLKPRMMELNPDAFAQALKDMNGDGKSILTDEQFRSAMMDFQTEMMATHAEKMKAAGEKNKKEGEAFLAENKKKEGVITLPSGLQYKVITMGNGEKPKSQDQVSVNYRGTLVDGTEFDNSAKTGKPGVFPVHGIIKGLSEALQLMPVGSKWEVYVPSDLAYGPDGRGIQILPNAVLIFDLELLGIEKATAAGHSH
ncbi:MAG TPA: FKBP-type peptidyl-prolyl cis-trans isomerase [Bacteroidota bacterium]|nr:FKBP-type peptidyl-prolyl cis-trans isomerase [Bacteroidota bacterium]